MTIDPEVLSLTQRALWLVLILAGPPVFVAAIVGLLIAFIQAATQLQEQTMHFAMKFVAITITLFVTASFAGGTLLRYCEQIFTEFPFLFTGV